MEIRYTNHLTAYLDILGFTNYINSITNDQTAEIQTVYELLNDIRAERNYDTSNYITTSFSDSVVISVNLENEESSTEAFSLFSTVLYLHEKLLRYHLFLRGAIVCDSLYHDKQNDIVFGPALIRAYKLESKIAKVPRVLVSPECLVAISEAERWDREQVRDYLHMLEMDGDNWLYINMFAIKDDDLENYPNYLGRLRESILSLRNNGHSCGSIREKYEWLREHFNKEICTAGYSGIEPIR